MEKTLNDPAVVKEIAVDAIRKTIHETFQTFLGLEVEVGSTPPASASTAVPALYFFGIIGMFGTWHGTGIFECSPECACALSDVMLGITDSSTNDAQDAVAEMSNVIFGGMKAMIEPTIGYISMNTPTVIYGAEVSMRHPSADFTTIYVQFREHNLVVKLYLASAEDEPPANQRRPGRHLKAA